LIAPVIPHRKRSMTSTFVGPAVRAVPRFRLGRVSKVGGSREMLRAWDEET
jgi:hypothetical protein